MVPQLASIGKVKGIQLAFARFRQASIAAAGRLIAPGTRLDASRETRRKGYSFGPHYTYNPSPRMYLYLNASHSKKSVQQLKAKVCELLVPSNTDPWPEVRQIFASPLWPITSRVSGC